MNTLRNGQEIYRSEYEIKEEIEEFSQFELARQTARFWTHAASNMPTKNIIIDSEKSTRAYVLQYEI